MKWYYPLAALPLRLIFLLPLRALYFLSDIVYVLLYYIAGYRKKVVMNNLRNAFPEKNEDGLLIIARAYYRHMVDVIFETLKLQTISEHELKERVKFSGIEHIEQLKKANKSFLFVLGHMGNWEWGGQAYSLLGISPIYALYHPLSSRFFNWFTLKLRSRFKTKLIPMNDVLREMAKYKNEFTATAFIADQTPQPQHAYWVEFLNQDTPVFAGTEKIARKFDYAVVYASCSKPGRGRYEIEFKLLTSGAGQSKEGELTRLHTSMLEKDIIRSPHIWLWSHRRWKHKRIKG